MGALLTIGLLVILFVCVALLGFEGLWSGAINFVNVLLAALLATSHFERVATWFDWQAPTFTYLADFLALWGLFALLAGVFNLITSRLSRVKVRFKRPVDLAGGFFFAAWTGWVMVCFTLMSLHTAPLPRNFLGGAFQAQPESRMFFGLAPDRQWLALVHKLSQTTFARSTPADDPEKYVFDRRGEFILKYAERRAAFERTEGIRVRRSDLSGEQR